MRIVLRAAMLGGLVLAGCREPGFSRATQVCRTFCECLFQDPSEQAECTNECREDFNLLGVTDDCYECVTESLSCFWTTEVCLEVCLDDGDDPVPVDAPLFLDAPF